ncbi:hypothetical protein GGR50DRAFT_668632 [Xylaria sp. CBS 124048]|nr:hypothetical protein GGR50DRAFT_668632 [Xylaria sp. CBS 124048]
MPALRSRKYLRCFYCGRRSNIQYEGQSSFDCSVCDATNWLDLNGEITDPPEKAAESRERNNVQYAIPRSSTTRSPSPEGLASDDSIFCATCLRNQHMLSSSIAQFEWPDDPTSAEHKIRERRYWALRKELEKRYPQVCQECLPRVNRKLREASYTAQTDHLRRIMDRTHARRAEVKRRGPLDVIDSLGKLGWYAGFLFQAVWHLTVLSRLLTEPYSSPTDRRWIPAALSAIYRMSVVILPYADWLMQWAVNLGVCSFPWNPRFKQSIRGFTAHILGFRQWYTYQFLALLVRFVAVSLAQYSKSQGLPENAELGAQLIMTLFAVHIYFTAKKSIHTDTTPLFQQPAELGVGLDAEPDNTYTTKDPNNLGNILDDILDSPPGKQRQAASTSPQDSPSSASAFRQPISHGSRYTSPVVRGARMTDSAFMLRSEEPPTTQNNDEMDWSPSASQHRAFSSYNPYRVKNTNPRFSDAPTEPKPGPMWYKVPPAPTYPAQRLRNPPLRPIIQKSPKEREIFFKPTERRPIQFGGDSVTNSTGLKLEPPKFYAPEPTDDPRDGLSNLFATSFTISPDPEEQKESSAPSYTATALPDKVPNRTMTRVAELLTLIMALCGWIFALGSEEHYGRSVALASICVCLIMSIRLTADLEVDRQIRGDVRSSTLRPSFANLALGQVVAAILLLWIIWSQNANASWVSSGVYGNTLFGITIVHHMRHILA